MLDLLCISLGGCGEVVNTLGCEPSTRQFDSGQPPHLNDIRILQQKYPDIAKPVFLFNYK